VNPNSDEYAWSRCRVEDTWVFDKLYVSRMSGHVCGPRGIDVPRADTYCVRPVVNIEGLGLGARRLELERETWHLAPGEFWCEWFEGEHISIDYVQGEPALCVRGHRTDDNLARWDRWERIESNLRPPRFVASLFARYRTVNCEFIGGRLIEVHLRGNPDFAYGNSEVIPVWPGQSTEREGWRFIPDDPKEELDRVGLLVR